jgi:hypothetical protein
MSEPTHVDPLLVGEKGNGKSAAENSQESGWVEKGYNEFGWDEKSYNESRWYEKSYNESGWDGKSYKEAGEY